MRLLYSQIPFDAFEVFTISTAACLSNFTASKICYYKKVFSRCSEGKDKSKSFNFQITFAKQPAASVLDLLKLDATF